MTTIAQAVAEIVKSHIDEQYILDCGFTNLSQVYQAEYGYNGKSPKACMDYLQGLPSVCTIPFCNSEILEILEANGITRKSEQAKANLIDLYWQTAGQVFYKLIK